MKTINSVANTQISNQQTVSQVANKPLNTTKFRQKAISAAVLCVVATTSIAAPSVNAFWTDNELAVVNTAPSEGDTALSPNTKEEIGFGVGMVVGAMVGGPIGAFVTGIAGNIIAKNINANDEIDTLNASLSESQLVHGEEVVRLKNDYEEKMQRLEQNYQNELLALEQNYGSSEQIKAEQLLMSLQFSTGSSDIAPHYQEQVSVLAQLLNSDPTLTIDLSGYTDLQGDESINQNLSKRRVETVKNLLIAQGVKEGRIQTFAYGDSAPLMATNQNKVSFYDRRVVLQVSSKNQTAKN